MPRPNILYIHSHDTGRYIQPYGHAVPTPHLQRLAEEGVLFRQAFCAAPTCSPSRACLLSGQAAHSNGMIGLTHRGFAMDYEKHLVRTLGAAGYSTALVGVQHEAIDPTVIGYDTIYSRERSAITAAPAAAEFLAATPREPFFLAVGFSETHREFHEPGATEDPRYCLPPAPLPDTPHTRRDMAAFKASARIMDDGIGLVLRALEENGLAENTLVISTCDHGIAFPGMKCNLTDHGTGVMLLMRGPGGFTGGKVCEAMISQIDIFPTLCELLEIDAPVWLQGRSMLPLMRGETEEINDAVFAEVNYHASYEPMRSVRTKRWKYIRRFDGRTTPVLPNSDDGFSKDVWREHGWRERVVEAEMLYDLIFDPNEAHNLVADPSKAGVLEEMRGRMERWMRETDDPLLNGFVPAPPGAKVNDPDGVSPQEQPLIV